MCTQLFDPKVDYIFKNIFGNENHPKILISFLNACIKPKSPITSVKIKNTELTKEYIEESFSRLDVLATTQDGEIVNIEMQRADEKNMVKRSLYYWSKIFSSSYQGKGRYSSLPRTICINVLDFNLLDEEHFHNTYILKNKENNNLLTDTLELHFVEIPKMKEIDQNDMLSLWTAFLNDPNNEKLIELEAKYEELHEAKVELARLSRDPKEAEKYRMRENAINERRNFFLETLDKGLKEGEKKAKIKIALKLKESLDINTISEMTDLSVSELEEIFSGKTI
ncbi:MULTISPECIES: Rpn family recombination-promoting nuclease/putative transposase [Romboutsia]|uniref:Rpn family recombination-promoting nuclease/putative transposase n=1 Tax=Romboutsia TaxID=1501226 RepID=UPI0021727B64|nr:MULTISPECIES: Rpn family recombination-promoting nuclease/putative transposase [Romboutsia]MCI9260038.1 Rpn family recombination-promoting nuclease/putative transposase [Romboutsia sp.]